MASSESRPASRTRKKAARYARQAHGEHAAEDRGGVDPAVHGSPALPPAGTRPEAMPPTTAPRQKGTSTDEIGEGGAEVAAVAGAEDRLAEREAGAAEHDAERGKGQRDEEGQGDRGVRLREAGPQHHEDEDQPDVVGLPHRCDRVVDDLAGPLPALGPPATRSQKPAPKSAPPKTAYIVTAANRMTAAVVAITAAPSARPPASSRRRRSARWARTARRPRSERLALAGTGGSCRAAPGSW